MTQTGQPGSVSTGDAKMQKDYAKIVDRGEVNGLLWIEVADAKGNPVVLLSHPRYSPTCWSSGRCDLEEFKYEYCDISSLPINPIPPGHFGDKKVKFKNTFTYSVNMHDYVRETFCKSVGKRLEWECNTSNGRLTAIIWTFQGNLLQKVREHVDRSIYLPIEIERISALMDRKHPAPRPQQMEMISLGAISAEVMKKCTHAGQILFHEWIGERQSKLLAGDYDDQSLSLDGSFFPEVPQIMAVRVRFSHHAMMPLFEIELEGGTQINDDEKGITILLEQKLAEAITAAMPKMQLNRFIDLPGAQDCVIRTSRWVEAKNKRGYITRRGTVVRASQPLVTYLPPEAVQNSEGSSAKESEEEIFRQIDAMIGEGKRYQFFSAALIPAFQEMEPCHLRDLLGTLEDGEQRSLDRYGLKTWIVKREGYSINLHYAPVITVRDASAIARKSIICAPTNERTSCLKKAA